MARDAKGNKKKFNHVNEFLKRRDIFGHHIALNFDNENPTHRTWVGGIFSLIIYGLIISMIISKAVRIVTYDNPDLNTIKERDPGILLADHKFTKMNMFNFHALKKNNAQVWLNTPNIERYVRIHFLYEVADWYKPWEEVY
jgi:hypothetical protein